MGDTTLRYSRELHKVDWVDIFNQALPYMSNYRKQMLVHISGQFSVSPLLMLGKIIQDQQKAKYYNTKNDEEFRIFAKSFANSLSRSEQGFDAEAKKNDISALGYALRRTFRNNDVSIKNYLNICDTIAKRYNISKFTSKTNLLDRQYMVKRDEEEQIILQLPYSSSECWQLGGTHFGAQETESSATNGAMSAIDMSPYLFSVVNLKILYDIYPPYMHLSIILNIYSFYSHVFLFRNGVYRLTS